MANLTIKTSQNPALTINRGAIKGERLGYFATANKKSKYKYGSSYIVYIGTTKSGANRIAASAAQKASEMLALHGVRQLEFYVVTSKPRKHVKTWAKLERALILTYREKFGEVPKCNQHGKRTRWTDELKCFTPARLRTVIEKFS
jgi:NAD(P)H-hydrate repair Nnr-like enzyme with NAD(P)H-hydrate dehydratase domain